MTYRTSKAVFVSPQAPAGTTIEKTDRQVEESWAGALEVIWIAAGCAGWAIAGGIGYAVFWRYAPLPWYGVVLGLAGMIFFLVAGLYTVLKFGLDEWQNPARILALEGMVAERDMKIAEQARVNEQIMSELETVQRPIVVTRAGQAAPDEPELLQVVRKIVDRKRLGLGYTRDEMVLKFHVLTQGEWTRAMALLSAAKMTVKGGVGGQQTLLKDLPPETILGAAKAKHIELNSQVQAFGE